jgi:hypothetical protein
MKSYENVTTITNGERIQIMAIGFILGMVTMGLIIVIPMLIINS